MLGKRLRKKIREACGLEELSKDEKKQRASEIIDDYDYKQSICIKYPGVTHKDIDRTMRGVLANKQPEKTEEELHPEKYGLDSQDAPWKRSGPCLYTTPTKEEVQWLIEQSKKPVVSKEQKHNVEARGYSREEVAALMAGDYHPGKFRYLKKKKK